MACENCLPEGQLSESDLGRYAGMLKAVGHPVRLRMVELIHMAGGELCVCEIERYFDLTQPTISHHLKALRDAGLISSRNDGSWVRHSIDEDSFGRMLLLIEGFAAMHSREKADAL